MNDKRREYKRVWESNKRRAVRTKKCLEKSLTFDTSDSEGDTPFQIAPDCPSMNTSGMANSGNIAIRDVEFVFEDSLSSDEECWNTVDQKCDTMFESSESDEDNPRTDLKSKLRAWAVNSKVTQNQLDELLPILNELDTSLPLTAKTLLKTGASVPLEVVSLSGGDYLYFGVRAGVTSVLNRYSSELNHTVLELAMNIDGVPLFQSSTYSLWPVLGCVINMKPLTVFVIALYGGFSKPSDLNFLTDAINELNELLINGIDINGKVMGFSLRFCVCDAVARAMVKCVKQCTGYYGCDKCCQRGIHDGRVTYPDCEAPLRDNESFRLQSNAEHHTGLTPFCALPVDMVQFFPIDYMHQVCLGVMRRLLVCLDSRSQKI